MTDRPEYFGYVVTPKASDDLYATAMFTLDKWGPEQATHYEDRLLRAFSHIAANVGSGRRVLIDGMPVQRFVVEEHIVIYALINATPAILRVFHHAQHVSVSDLF